MPPPRLRCATTFPPSRLGRDIRRSALFATLHVEGVQRVELQEPAADVVLDETQAAYCTGYAITLGGVDE